MTWMHKPKHRTLKPERCQRCLAQAPTEEIRMLWQAREAPSADGAQDWWFGAACAADLRRGAPPSAS
jgi:hypothetical protein